MMQALKLHSRISKGIVSLDHVRTPAKFIISGEHACISVALMASDQQASSMMCMCCAYGLWHMLQNHELSRAELSMSITQSTASTTDDVWLLLACDHLGGVIGYWGCDGTSLEENRMQLQQLADRHSTAGQPVGEVVLVRCGMPLSSPFILTVCRLHCLLACAPCWLPC
jgi:hypothetical protein